MTAAKLKAEVTKLERQYRGHRYPAALRWRIVELADSRRSEGASWGRIGAEVGIKAETLRRWCTGSRVNGEKMVPVQVVEPEDGVVVSSARGPTTEDGNPSAWVEVPNQVPLRVVDGSARGGMTLVSPTGWRVEGLGLEDVAALLRSPA